MPSVCSLMVSDLRSETKGRGVRGELFAVISSLMSTFQRSRWNW